jgi:hypothetical protein
MTGYTEGGTAGTDDEGVLMGIFSKFAKAGAAKKAVGMARKPANQAKAKRALSSARGKTKSGRRGR